MEERNEERGDSLDTPLLELDKIIENIFAACDTENSGSVVVSKLIEFMKPYMHQNNSALTKLISMLDPDATDRSVDKETFFQIMTTWTSSLKEDSNESLVSNDDSFRNADSLEFLAFHSTPRAEMVLQESISGQSFACEKIRLEEQIQELTHQSRKLTDELHEVRAQLTATEDQNEALSKDVERISKRLLLEQQVNEQLQRCCKENEDLRETSLAYTSEIEGLKKQLAETKKECVEMKAKIEAFEKEKLSLETKIEELENCESELKSKVEALQCELDAQEVDVSRTEVANTQLEEKLEEIHSLCEYYKNMSEALKQEKEDLETKLRDSFTKTYTLYKLGEDKESNNHASPVKTSDPPSCPTPFSPAQNRRGSHFFKYNSPLAKFCSPRPFNSPRLLAQLANPVKPDWSPLPSLASDVNANTTPEFARIDSEIKFSSTPKETPDNREQNDSIYLTPSADFTTSGTFTSPDKRSDSHSRVITYVSDDDKGLVAEALVLYSSEENVDWKMNLINLSQKQGRRDSLHSELVEATNCYCRTHKCFDVIDQLRKENETTQKSGEELVLTIRTLTKELNDLKSELSLKNDKENLLIEIKSELEAKLTQSKAQMHEFRLKLEVAQEVEDKCRELEEKIKELEYENSCKFIEIVDLKETVEALEQSLKERATVEKELEQEGEEKDKLRTQVETLEGVIRCLRGIEEAESILKQTLETKAFSPEYETFLENTMISTSDSLTLLHQERQRLVQKCLSLGLEINVKNSHIENVRKTIDTQIKKNAKFARLQENKMRSKDDEIKALTAELEEKSIANQKLQRDLETLNAQTIVKQEEMEELKNLVRILQDSEGAKVANATREADKEKALHKENVKHYEEVVEKLNALNVQQQNDYDALKENFVQLKSEKENLIEELESARERLKYFKELYNKAVIDCEEILDEKNRLQRTLSKTLVNSSYRLGQVEERKVCDELDLRAEKEALKEERADWEKLRKSLTEKFSEEFSDVSSDVSYCDSRHSRVVTMSKESPSRVRRSNFEKLQIKIERLQCKIEEQQRLLREERERSMDLEIKLEGQDPSGKGSVKREVNCMEVRLRESNRNLSALLEAMKSNNTAKPKQWLKRSPLSAVSCWPVADRRLDSGEPADSFHREGEGSVRLLMGLKGLVDVTWMLSDSLRIYGLEFGDEPRIPHVSSSGVAMQKICPSEINKFLMRPSNLVMRPVSPDSPSLPPEEPSGNISCGEPQRVGSTVRSSAEDYSDISMGSSSVFEKFSDNQRQLPVTEDEVSMQSALRNVFSSERPQRASENRNGTERDLEKLYREAMSVLSRFCVSAEQCGAVQPEMLANLKLMHDHVLLLKEQLGERGPCRFTECASSGSKTDFVDDVMRVKSLPALKITNHSLVRAPISMVKWVVGKVFTFVFTLMAVIGLSSVLLEVCYNSSGMVRPHRYPWSYMSWEEILAPFMTRNYNAIPPY